MRVVKWTAGCSVRQCKLRSSRGCTSRILNARRHGKEGRARARQSPDARMHATTCPQTSTTKENSREKKEKTAPPVDGLFIVRFDFSKPCPPHLGACSPRESQSNPYLCVVWCGHSCFVPFRHSRVARMAVVVVCHFVVVVVVLSRWLRFHHPLLRHRHTCWSLLITQMSLVMVLAWLALMVLLRHHPRRRQFLVWHPLHQPLSHYWGSRTLASPCSSTDSWE